MAASFRDDEYLKQVLERFGARRTSFVKQFTVLAVFAFAFPAFILAPMLSLTLDGHRLERELRMKQQELQDRQAELDRGQAEMDALVEQRDLLNGKLTSLHFVQAQKEEEAAATEARLAESRRRATEISKDRENLEERLKSLRRALADIGTAPARFDADERTNDLRLWFRDIASSGSVDPECENDREFGRLGCMVRNKLHADWDRDFAAIDERIIAPLRSVAPEEARLLEESIAKVRERFEAQLDADPDFWHTLDEKHAFMDVLHEEFVNAFNSIEASVKERVAALRQSASGLKDEIARRTAELERLRAEADQIASDQADIAAEIESGFAEATAFERKIAALETDLAMRKAAFADEAKRIGREIEEMQAKADQIKGEMSAIESRLTDIQSPLGKLPIGVKEATLAFPVVIAVGFLICASLMADLIRLRSEYHALMSAAAAEGARIRDRVILLAPLLLDPARPAWRGLPAMGLFLLPALIFAAAVALNMSGILDQPEQGSWDRYLRAFYYGLYAVGLGLVILGLYRVGGMWYAYRGRIEG